MRFCPEQRGFTGILLRVVICWFCLFSSAPAGTATSFQVMAAMMVKFTDFVKWPSSAFPAPEAPFRVGIMGSPVLLEQLKPLSGHPVQTHPLEFVTVDMETRHLDEFQILFISGTLPPSLSGKLPDLARSHVLTISDKTAFLDQGGLLCFIRKPGGHLGFAVNRDVQLASGLRFSSALLRLADIHVASEVEP